VSDEERSALLARFPTRAAIRGTYTASEMNTVMRAHAVLKDSPEWLATDSSTPAQTTMRNAARETRTREARAWRDGRLCATCGTELGDDATLWRYRTRSLTPPHCERCAQKWLWVVRQRSWCAFLGPIACKGCGRPVHFTATTQAMLLRTVCSERCSAIAHNADRRAKRAPARQRTCTNCGQPFVARRDARTCSRACRQRAYRQRQAAATTAR
jgi:hypothetical protein